MDIRYIVSLKVGLLGKKMPLSRRFLSTLDDMTTIISGHTARTSQYLYKYTVSTSPATGDSHSREKRETLLPEHTIIRFLPKLPSTIRRKKTEEIKHSLSSLPCQIYAMQTVLFQNIATHGMISGTYSDSYVKTSLINHCIAAFSSNLKYFEFYAFYFVKMADLPSDVEPLPVRLIDITGRNYAEVKRKLSLTNDPNKLIDHHPLLCSITGMEFSVLCQDWKMVLIFFLAGADPNQNRFDGILRDPMTDERLQQYEAFRSEEGEFQPLPGFRGLQRIMDVVVARFSEVTNMRATLWLTKQLHDNATGGAGVRTPNVMLPPEPSIRR
jgi:hypothetical protein